MYHTGAPMGRRLRLAFVLVLAVAASACADRGPTIREVGFPPGRHVVRHDGVRVELLHAIYDDRGVSLTLGVKNGGAAPVTIDRAGILLAHQDLEFPIATDPEPTIAAITSVPPGGAVQLAARFTFGHRLEDTATLRVRIARRGEAWIEGLAVPVPPGFAAADEDVPPEQP
jgi:hypothetical protein